jgi:inositol-pentakisphosphate 2-kinase
MRSLTPRRREDITPPTIIPPWAISTASHAESNIGGNESSPNDVQMQLEIVESNDYEEISEPVIPSSPSSTSLKRKDSLPESEPVVPSSSSSTSLKRKVSISPESPRKGIATDHLVESTDPKEWKYIAEGGANVVFSYEGSDVLFKGKVLRVKKVSSESPTPANVYWTETGLRQVLCGVQAEHLLPLNEHISVKSSWVQQLDALSRPFRPPHRTKGKNADLDSGPHAWITLTENLHRGKGYFAVELKPKVGFSSGPVCRYCLKRSGKEPQPGFCPIDLYSTDYRPRYTALQYLVRDWHAGQAGNNLRVFEDGLPGNIDQSLTSGNRLSHMLGDILGDSRVLDVLLQLQQGYDRLSFKDDEIPDAEEEAEARELATLLKAWPHVSDTRGKRIAYTISAIFKDCSLIIAWPKEDVKNYSIGLVDLDIKPMSKFARWKKQETDREYDDSITIFCGAGGRRGKTIPVLPMIPLGSDTTAVLTRETKRLQSIEDEHKIFLEWLRAAPHMTGKDFTDTAAGQHIL